MAFEPSVYSDAASAITDLAPLAISAGTTIATTAITGKRAGKRKRRHQAKAPPPPPPGAGFPVMPALAVGTVLVLGIGFVLTRKKPAAAA